jgi:uncharacterized protein (TIGR02466 family)
MEYIDIFPTPLYVSSEIELSKEILPVAEDYIDCFGVNYRSQEKYISTYNVNTAAVHQRTDQRLNKLNSYIKSAARKYFEDHCIDSTGWSLSPYYLFNKITSGGSHPSHTHPGSILSGCFYLKIPQSAPSIIFTDPRSYWNHVYYPPKFGESREKYKLLSEYVITPTDGLFLMWPSWLEHEVPESTINEERIVVAFNLNA